MLNPVGTELWTFEKAAHLLNRAGFGRTPAEIEELTALGPEQAVKRLVDYEAIPDSTPAPAWAKPDPERFTKIQEARKAGEEARRKLQREEQAQQRQQILDLRSISGASMLRFWKSGSEPRANRSSSGNLRA